MRSAGIADQNIASRRGLLLGMTLAEVILLVLFCLLLMLGALSRSDQDNERWIEVIERTLLVKELSQAADREYSAFEELMHATSTQSNSATESISDTWQRITDEIQRSMENSAAGEEADAPKPEELQKMVAALEEKLENQNKKNEFLEDKISKTANQNEGLIEQVRKLKAGSPPPCLHEPPSSKTAGRLRGKTIELGTIYIQDGSLTLTSINQKLKEMQTVDYVGNFADPRPAINAISAWPLGQKMSVEEFSSKAKAFIVLGDNENSGKLKCRFTMNYKIDDYVTPHAMFTDVFLKYFYRQVRVQ